MKSRILGIGGMAVAVTAASAVAGSNKGSSLAHRRAAVERALPYLAQQTGTWIEKNKCTSCHQVPHALWAMNAAKACGFAVDDRLGEWNRWSLDYVTKEAERSEKMARLRADEIGQLLMAGSVAYAEADSKDGKRAEDARRRFAALLRVAQQEDGTWSAGGRLPGQDRPEQETNEATTMWIRHTLQVQRLDGDKSKASSDESPSGVDATSTTTEHLFLRYLMAVGDGEGTTASKLRSEILAQQNDDGGWGWKLDGDSDALATGQAIYALTYLEPEHRCDAVRRAQQFLVKTQQEDGHWLVPATLASEEGTTYDVSNDWGTAWAVIGLMRTMDK